MSRWTRTRVIVEFAGFPRDIADIVAGYCMKLELLPWIDESKLDIGFLYSNPKALLAGMIDPRFNHYCIAANPTAGDIIKSDIDTYADYASIWENPSVLEYLIENGYEIDPEWFSFNPHPKAVAMVISGEVKMDEHLFNENPGAIDWLRANPDKINGFICGNPAAIDIIQAKAAKDDQFLLDNVRELSHNPHSWAIEWLHNNQSCIDWDSLSTNPGIFEWRTDPRLVDALSDDR